MERKKVGLALGGGAAKGFAHLGVLEVLEKEKIPIDIIAGTSMGAIIGAFYAYSKDLPSMRRLAIEMGKKRLRIFTDLTIPRTGILSWRKVEKQLYNYFGKVRFEDLSIPFECVAVDIDSGEEIVLNEGEVWHAIRASASVPVMLPLTEIRGQHLVDGGILNPVPVRLVKSMGADIVIAVNVIPMDHHVQPLPHHQHTIFSIMLKTMYIFNNRVIESSLGGADVVVQVDTGAIGYTDFHKAADCIECGKTAAQLMMPKIKKLLQPDSKKVAVNAQ
jgi:NTE family protein